MRIMHLCLSCFYNDNYTYQENLLPSINKEDGHEVRIVASTEVFVDNARLGYVTPSSYETADGIPVTRLPYRKWLPHIIMKKLRAYPGVYDLLEDFAPDVILFHGCQAWELRTVVRYKRKHPHVKLYADSHEDKQNSARTWLSRNTLYRLFYVPVYKRAEPYLDKVFYILPETKEFMQEHMNADVDKLGLYSLGGLLPDDAAYANSREKKRAELGLKDTDILLLHTGKMEVLKRTPELLAAFSNVRADDLCLAVIGSIPEEMKEAIMPALAADPRIRYLGWKSGAELWDYLCACDLYMQPGKISATMQNALCCRCAAAVYPHPSYTEVMGDSLFYVETQTDIERLLTRIAAEPELLLGMRQKALKVAREKLDYRVLAARLYEGVE